MIQATAQLLIFQIGTCRITEAVPRPAITLTKLVGRNVATFTCELDDGRKFNAMADYNIFRRLQRLAKS
jgi:hypothetical protein